MIVKRNAGLVIDTPRLLIREILPSDDKGMFEMDSDPQVHRFINNKPVSTLEESRETIRLFRKQYEDFGIARWVVIEKATGEFVGWTGFKFIECSVNNHSHYYDFGYRFCRKHWGKGYASESGKASLRHGLEQMSLKKVFAMTSIENVVSRHVLEKLGFEYVETFAWDGPEQWKNLGAPVTWYRSGV